MSSSVFNQLHPRNLWAAFRMRTSRFSRLRASGRVIWGEGSYGPPNIRTYAGDDDTRLIVGRYCSIASTATFLLGGGHPTDRPALYPIRIKFGLPGAGRDGFPATRGDIVVEDGAWIGHGALILSGVTVGRGAVVAAGAVVARDVAPYWIVAGNPAAPVRQRLSEAQVGRTEATRWWEKAPHEVAAMVDELSGPVEHPS